VSEKKYHYRMSGKWGKWGSPSPNSMGESDLCTSPLKGLLGEVGKCIL